MTSQEQSTPSSLLNFLLRLLRALLSGGQPLLGLLFFLLPLHIYSQMERDLHEVEINAKSLKEKKFGVKKRSAGLHLIDGIVDQKNSFEIAQSIKLPQEAVRITSLRIFLQYAITDTAVVKINFYSLKDFLPGERIIDEPLSFRKEIKTGWLNFDLREHQIYLKGDCVAGIEFLSGLKGSQNIDFEVKLGGSSKSFNRDMNNEQWQTIPHHYLMYLTALVPDKWEEEEKESTPSHLLYSKSVNDSFYVFMQLPVDYNRTNVYPVVYVLDANAYFDALAEYTLKSNLRKRKEVIIVGIGYKNGYEMDSLRMRDYRASHGAAKFYDFITGELIPFIERNYSTDKNKRTLAGHSLGGDYCLYAMSRDRKEGKNHISNYISVSPDLEHKIPSGAFASHGEHVHDNRLFLAFGGKEISSKREAENLQKLAKSLAESSINFEIYTVPKAGHMDAALPGFEKGLEHFLK